MRANESLLINIAASEWLASKTGTSLLECPGTHLAYCQRPSLSGGVISEPCSDA
jgi:hypothetical protein